MPKDAKQNKHSFQLKPACAAILLAFSVQNADANPVGGSVASGQASFNTTGSTLTVTNTPGTIIHWQDFSIQQNEITRFAQQSASSAVLNRVVTNNPSLILGSLQSNGRVFLVNPNGIVFGAGSTVDVAGLVATSLNLSDADFLAGRHRFTNPSPNGGGAGVGVTNAGNITAQQGGEIYLIAPNVENSGIITAPNGEILLAAGHEVQLVNSLDPNLRVNITAPAGDATNVGQLIASSGSLGLFGTVVRNTGTVSADSATLQGGKIVFKSSQRTEISGTVTATSTAVPSPSASLPPLPLAGEGLGRGGEIQILGNQVGIMDGATVTANGAQGGGTILVGGDYQGKNPNVPNAQVTYVAPTASISANGGIPSPSASVPSPSGGGLGWGSSGVGNGGKVIVWADNATRAYGSISAQGGANGGNGGFIETSGKQYLDVAGIRVSTAAPHGTTGNWLLDPTDITIVHATAASGATFTGPTYNNGGVQSSMLSDFDINANLATSDITITTSSAAAGLGDIKFNANGAAIVITNTTGAARTLTLTADHDIVFLGGSTTFQTAAGGSLGVNFNPGAGRMVNVQSGASAIFNGNNGLVAAYIGGASGKTWENYGTVTLSGVSYLDLNSGVTSTFNNNFGGTLNLASTQGWAIQSWNVAQAEPINNAGTVNVTAGTSIEAAYSQSASGTLTVAPGQFLNLQNANILNGIYNIGAGSTLALNEVHSGARTFSFATINDAGTLSFGAFPATFDNTNLFYTGGTGDYTLPTGITYSGNVGFWATGNLTVSTAIGTALAPAGFVTLRADSAGACVAGAAACSTVIFTGAGHVTAAGTNIYYNPTGSNNAADANGVGPSYLTPTSYIGNVTGPLGAWMLVNDVNQLQGMNTNQTGNYALGRSFDATATSGWNAGLGFAPVGDNLGPPYGFSGQFDGQYHTINNLTINRPLELSVGLFGYVGWSGSVSNVGLLNINVSGNSNVGGLVGYNNNGSISNSYVSGGTVTGSGNYVGGLMGHGYSAGFIGYNSVDSLLVSGGTVSAGTGNYVGGLLGYDSGEGIYQSNTVTGTTVNGNNYVGGLAGMINNGWSIIAGYSDDNHVASSFVNGGVVSGGAFVGGLVGWNGNPLSYSDVSGSTVTSTYHAVGDSVHAVGGLVGYNAAASQYTSGSPPSVFLTGGRISNSYVSGGSVQGLPGTGLAANGIGGLVGENTGAIGNSYVSGGSVTGTLKVGGLVGSNVVAGATIANSFVINTIVSNTASMAGGLAGYNFGSISTSYVSGGSVTGFNGAGGGLVGYNYYGTINTSYVTQGTAVSSIGSSYVGGLVGVNFAGTIDRTYVGAAVVVSGSTDVGGLVGVNLAGDGGAGGFGVIIGFPGATGSAGSAALISNSYVNQGTVTGTTNVGGLVGRNAGGNGGAGGNATGSGMLGGAGGAGGVATVSTSYASGGLVTGATAVGGLIGNNVTGISGAPGTGTSGGTGGTGGAGGLASTTGSFWDVDTTLQALAIGAGNPDIVTAIRSTTPAINAYNQATYAGLDFAATWWISEGNTRPFLRMESNSSITNAHNLQLIGMNATTLAASYTQVNNINLTAPLAAGGMWNVANGFVPLGGGGLPGFTGWFEGLGYTISNLTIKGAGGAGLFGAVGFGGTVSGVGLINSNVVVAGSNVGGLAGSNAGTIVNSYVSNGTVFVAGAYSSVGGLVGSNSGSIINSYVSGGSVHGEYSAVGGLAGKNIGLGSIDNSFVSNVIVVNAASWSASVGGLVGNNSGSISNSYVNGGSVASLSSGSVGGLVGSNSGSISNSYASAGSVVNNGILSSAGPVGGLVGGNNSIGSIINSHVSGSTVSGMLDVGGVVGNNAGVVTNSYADTVTVTMATSGSAFNIGGLVGTNSGNISNSYVSGGTVGASTTTGFALAVGGLVGSNSGTISNTYVTGGTVTGYTQVAGLVGVNTVSGSINMSYVASGTVAGCCTNYGLVASNAGSIQNSFWDTQTTGAINGVTSGTIVNVLGLTSAEMQQQSSFTGWDFTNTWRIYNGHTAPLLKSFLAPVTVTASGIFNDFTKSYDGGAYNPPPLGTLSYSDPLAAGSLNESTPFGGAVNVGSYEMFWSGQQGYDISYAGGDMLTITPAVVNLLDITANDASKTYGNTFFFLGTEFTPVGLVGGDNITGVTLTSSGAVDTANAGAHSIVVTPGSEVWGQGLASNYIISYVDGVLTVNPATLSIDAVTDTRFYDGTTASAVGVNVVGLMTWDSVTGASQVFGSKNVLGANLSTLSVNGYTINDTNGGANYIVTSNTATGTINPLSVTLTAPNLTKTYDGGLGYTTTGADLATLGGSLVGGDVVSAANFTYTDKNAGAGNKTVLFNSVAINDGNGGGNYNIIALAGNGTSTINRENLIVTANNLNKVLGTPDPLLTYMVSGLHDPESSVLTVVLVRDTGEVIGTYTINAQTLTLLDIQNYNPIIYVPGTFRILAPTVVQEITEISLKKKKDVENLLLALLDQDSDLEDNLPVCR